MVQDITDRKAAEEVLLLQALHDPLTGLPNRILFRERVGIGASIDRADAVVDTRNLNAPRLVRLAKART